MALTAKQRMLAELMVAEPELTNVEYAKRIPIDPKTLYKWKKTDEFQDYLHTCCVQEFKAAEKLAIRRLIQNADKGNQKAIEYLLNYLAYQPAQKVDMDMRNDIVINIEGDGNGLHD